MNNAVTAEEANARRLVFQLAAELSGLADCPPAAVFALAVRTALRAFKRDFPGEIPDGANTGRSFEVHHLGSSLACMAVPEDGLWSARLDASLSRPGDGGQVVSGTTEVSLVKTARGADVGVRVFQGSSPVRVEGRDRQCPPVVTDLAAALVLEEARLLVPRPWNLVTGEDLESFLHLVTSAGRALPVFLLTQPPREESFAAVHPFLLDAESLAQRTLGVAYVVTMPAALGYRWTNMVSKMWSAYLGAVRTYLPGLQMDEDSPSSHPLKLAEAVLNTRYGGQTGPAAYADVLVDFAYRSSGIRRVRWGRLRFLVDARIRQAELALRQVERGDDGSQAALLGQELLATGQKLRAVEEERDVAMQLADEAEAARLEMQDEVGRLRGRLDEMRRMFIRETGADPDARLRVPESYQELDEWVRTNLPGRLDLHPRARRGLRDAQYADVGLVTRALLLLAQEYREMKLGERGALEAFKEGCKQLGVTFGKSIIPQRAGEEGEAYFVRLGAAENAPRRFLEFHLRKGSGKDPRRCLAIYFLWDDETQRVIVGWLPSHLDNRMT